jgi:hypothetical protein
VRIATSMTDNEPNGVMPIPIPRGCVRLARVRRGTTPASGSIYNLWTVGGVGLAWGPTTRRSFTVGLALIALQPGAPADAWERAQSLYSGSITRIVRVERRQNKSVSWKCESGLRPLRVQEQRKRRPSRTEHFQATHVCVKVRLCVPRNLASYPVSTRR